MLEECQGPCDSYVKVCSPLLYVIYKEANVVTIMVEPRLCYLYLCFGVFFRLACSQTVILATDRRLRWFLVAGTPSSHRPSTCKYFS